MKKITNAEIRALKEIIREQREEIADLRAQLEESRAKEGKGCLERVIESIGDVVSNICDALSEMSPEELEELRALADEITIEDEEDDDT